MSVARFLLPPPFPLLFSLYSRSRLHKYRTDWKCSVRAPDERESEPASVPAELHERGSDERAADLVKRQLPSGRFVFSAMKGGPESPSEPPHKPTSHPQLPSIAPSGLFSPGVREELSQMPADVLTMAHARRFGSDLFWAPAPGIDSERDVAASASQCKDSQTAQG